MTIEKPFYTAPSGDPDKDPQYIDPKELEQIFIYIECIMYVYEI